MDIEKISLHDYLSDFMRTFNNFLSKCPLTTKCSLVEDTGNLYIEIVSNNKKSVDGFSYTVDPSKDKQSQIKEIKDKLQNFYPIITQEKSVPYSTEEVEKLVSSGTPIEEALKMRHITTINKYKIIRVHHRYNEFDCYDYESRRTLKFRLRFKENYTITTAIFLSKLQDNPTSMSKLFFNAFEFKYVLK